MIEVVALVLVAVFALASMVMACWMFTRSAKRTQEAYAQSDEHVKMALVAMEKAINRYYAAASPESFVRNRQNSGTVEGAQYATKLQMAGEKKAPTKDETLAQLRRQQAEQEARMVSVGGMDNIPVTNPLDFENLNGAGRP